METKLYISQEFITKWGDRLYPILCLVGKYAGESIFQYAKPKKVLSKERKVEPLGERNGNKVSKITVVTVIEEDKSGNKYSLSMKIPTTMVAIAKDTGISRQSLAEVKDTIKEFREGGLNYEFSSSFYALTMEQVWQIIAGLQKVSPQRRNTAAKIWCYMIINCNKFKRFNHNYDTIVKEIDCCREAVSLGIKDAIDCGIIQLLHKGNNLNGLSNSYALTDDFKNLQEVSK